MKKTNGDLRQDVEQLLKGSVAEEAVNEVWKRFENALAELDEESQLMFADFLAGTNAATLAEKRGLECAEVESWIKQIKRQVNEKLRQTCKVRQ